MVISGAHAMCHARHDVQWRHMYTIYDIDEGEHGLGNLVLPDVLPSVIICWNVIPHKNPYSPFIHTVYVSVDTQRI